MKKTLLVVGAAVMMAATARAQDAVKADPKHYVVLAENDRVRVLKASYGPGEKSVMHDHPDTFAVYLTDSKVRFGLPDGTSQEVTGKPGDARAIPAGKHSPENLGAAMQAIVVEVKAGVSAPAPVTGAVPAPAGTGVTRTPIASGPHGEAVLLKTEAAFSEPAGSKHEYDAVVVPMTDSGAELTIDGKTVTMKKGQAYLISRGAPHAVNGSGPAESVVVYIKQ